MKTFTSRADANWKGSLEEGHGLVSTRSRALAEERFSFSTRLGEKDGEVTPEELIGAAITSCFAMALSKTLGDEGVVAEKLRTGADVTLHVADDGPSINNIALNVEGLVPGYSEEKFKEAVSRTEKNCPLYKLLRPGVETLTVSASLVS